MTSTSRDMTGLRAEDEVGHLDAIFEDVAAAVERALAKSAEIENGFAKHFAGNGSGVDADAADGALAVDDGDLLARVWRRRWRPFGRQVRCRSRPDRIRWFAWRSGSMVIIGWSRVRV